MNNQSIKIVADSSCDLFTLEGVPFEVAPLKILTADREYVDTRSLDVLSMVTDLQNYKGKSSTSCPNSADWLDAFGDAQQVFCVTITGTLSGSYNAAVIAKQTYEEQYPDRQVFVLNTLSAGPEIALIIDRLQQRIAAGDSYDDICTGISEYAERTGLLFMLESMRNLENNGRVSHLVARMAGLLGIRVVGRASDQGDLEPLNKCRGEQKALVAITEQLRELGLRSGRVNIAHCFNESAAERLKEMIESAFDGVTVSVYRCGGLCSFYAEKGGLLVGFEKM